MAQLEFLSELYLRMHYYFNLLQVAYLGFIHFKVSFIAYTRNRCFEPERGTQQILIRNNQISILTYKPSYLFIY